MAMATQESRNWPRAGGYTLLVIVAIIWIYSVPVIVNVHLESET